MKGLNIVNGWDIQLDKDKQKTVLNHYLRDAYRKTLNRIDVPEYSDQEYYRVLNEHIVQHKRDTPDDLTESVIWLAVHGGGDIYLSFLKHRLLPLLDAEVTFPIIDYLAKDLIMTGIDKFIGSVEGNKL